MEIHFSQPKKFTRLAGAFSSQPCKRIYDSLVLRSWKKWYGDTLIFTVGLFCLCVLWIVPSQQKGKLAHLNHSESPKPRRGTFRSETRNHLSFHPMPRMSLKFPPPCHISVVEKKNEGVGDATFSTWRVYEGAESQGTSHRCTELGNWWKDLGSFGRLIDRDSVDFHSGIFSKEVEEVVLFWMRHVWAQKSDLWSRKCFFVHVFGGEVNPQQITQLLPVPVLPDCWRH